MLNVFAKISTICSCTAGQLKICYFKVSCKITIVIHKNQFKDVKLRENSSNAGIFNKLRTFPTLVTPVKVDLPSDSGGD